MLHSKPYYSSTILSIFLLNTGILSLKYPSVQYTVSLLPQTTLYVSPAFPHPCAPVRAHLREVCGPWAACSWALPFPEPILKFLLVPISAFIYLHFWIIIFLDIKFYSGRFFSFFFFDWWFSLVRVIAQLIDDLIPLFFDLTHLGWEASLHFTSSIVCIFFLVLLLVKYLFIFHLQ